MKGLHQFVPLHAQVFQVCSCLLDPQVEGQVPRIDLLGERLVCLDLEVLGIDAEFFSGVAGLIGHDA